MNILWIIIVITNISILILYWINNLFYMNHINIDKKIGVLE